MLSRRRSHLLIFTSLVLFFIIYNHFISDSIRKAKRNGAPGASGASYSKELVVASLKSDNTSWLQEHLPDWRANVYVVDDPKAELTVPINKGREAMAYLTYIINRYEDLPEYMVFIHGLRYQWHNDDPIYDGVPVIRALSLPHVSRNGYASLRCTWVPGCPNELYPLNPQDPVDDDRSQSERGYAAAFKYLFPGTQVPEVVGAPCSSQFAVTRQQVWRRPKADYERMRKWLIETELSDKISGRVMEYSWHIIMQMPPVYCPPAGECFCIAFGLCDLKCTAAACDKRYILPQYTILPAGWPDNGGGQFGLPIPGWNE